MAESLEVDAFDDDSVEDIEAWDYALG